MYLSEVYVLRFCFYFFFLISLYFQRLYYQSVFINLSDNGLKTNI